MSLVQKARGGRGGEASIRGLAAWRCAAANRRRRKANHAPPNALAPPVPPRFAAFVRADASAAEAPPGRRPPSRHGCGACDARGSTRARHRPLPPGSHAAGSAPRTARRSRDVPLFGEQAHFAHPAVQHVVRISPGGNSQSSWHDLRLPSSTSTVKGKDSRPLPERAFVVKGSLCGFCRLGMLLCLLYLRTIFVVRQNGLGAVHVVQPLVSLLGAMSFASTCHRVPICFREV